MAQLPAGFLWGASTAPHQIEGNNINSDWWQREGLMPGFERSLDAIDSYHRYAEDMQLLAGAGLNAYRFGIEWARIEPLPGAFSNAELAHYRRMIDTAIGLGLAPVITLNHFTLPRWFAERGGWMADGAIEHFVSYVTRATDILDGVPWVATFNEPNMLAMMVGLERAMKSGKAGSAWQSPTVDSGPRPPLPPPDPEVGARLIEAHHAVRDIIRQRTDAGVGWTVANRALETLPGGEAKTVEISRLWEDDYLEAARGDDFIGVQSYTTQSVDENGLVPHAQHPDNTLVGTPVRPDALGIAIRHTWDVTGGVPILVTENGIAITDDARRIAYTGDALRHLVDAVDDGIDVRGYLHWSALDNYEWGHWEPTFGLIAVDRETFVRTPKPSLAWLGGVARANAI